MTYTYAGCLLRIDYIKEEGLKTTSCSECALNALQQINLLTMQGYIANHRYGEGYAGVRRNSMQLVYERREPVSRIMWETDSFYEGPFILPATFPVSYLCFKPIFIYKVF